MIYFKTSGNYQYAEVLVNGKTGSRHIPHLKDWLDDHPHRSNPNAVFLCGTGRGLGRILQASSRYFGNESSESLPEVYGIVIKDSQQNDALRPKQCPNCNEPNKPDSKFCGKCRMVLTSDAYNETVEEKGEKEKELQSVKERMANIESLLVAIQPLLQNIKPELIDKLQIVGNSE